MTKPALRTVDIHNAPFPHVCVSEFLPNDTYRGLTTAWSSLSFKPMPSTGRDIFSRYYERGVFEFTDDSIATVAAHSDTLLRLRKHLLDKGNYRSLIESILPPALDIAAFERSVVDIIAVEDRPGYSLSPHTDSPAKFGTFVIYVPDDGSDMCSGSVLMRANSRNFASAREFHHPWDSFSFAKQIQYLPNYAFGFVRGDRSFHAVRPVLAYRRRLLIVTFYRDQIPLHFVKRLNIMRYNRSTCRSDGK